MRLQDIRPLRVTIMVAACGDIIIRNVRPGIPPRCVGIIRTTVN